MQYGHQQHVQINDQQGGISSKDITQGGGLTKQSVQGPLSQLCII